MKRNKWLENSWWEDVLDALFYENSWWRTILIIIFLGTLIWIVYSFITPHIEKFSNEGLWNKKLSDMWDTKLVDITGIQLMFLFAFCMLIWRLVR